jgi:multidrug resistance efflux pump
MHNDMQAVRGITIPAASNAETYARVEADIKNATAALRQHLSNFEILERGLSQGEAQNREARAEFERLESGFDAFLRSVPDILADHQRQAFAAWKAAKK